MIKKINMKDKFKDKLKFQFIFDDKYDRILILDNKKMTFTQIMSVEADFPNTRNPKQTNEVSNNARTRDI